MMLTEDQAREKWCPHSRLGEEDGSSSNRWYNNPTPPPCLCLGSACMAWRWAEPEPNPCQDQLIWWPETEDEAVLRAGAPRRPDAVPVDAEWIPWVDRDGGADGAYWLESEDAARARVAAARASRRGYCGLAGRME